jgi:hypothetical protein
LGENGQFRPRFGLFEAANWIGEILSRDEDKGKELPEAEFVGLGSGHRVARSPFQISKKQHRTRL